MAQINPEQIIKIKLDLIEGWKNKQTIEIKQADNETRYLAIRLTNLLPINITTYQPVVFVKRADGQILKGLGQVLNAENGEIVFELKSEHLAINGSLVFEVVLTKDETKIMSFPQFTLSVVDSIHDEDVFTPSEEDKSILWEMIGKLQNATNGLDEKYTQFEQSKEVEFQASESLRQDTFTQSESTRQTTFAQSEEQRNNTFTENETQRQFQEQTRQQAETIRQEGYTEMQSKIDEVYSTSLKYRIVE